MRLDPVNLNICSFYGNVMTIFFSKNETLVATSCCPACVPVHVHCRLGNGLVYRDGDQWTRGACETCQCIRGVTQCFKSECTSCPSNATAVYLQGLFENFKDINYKNFKLIKQLEKLNLFYT